VQSIAPILFLELFKNQGDKKMDNKIKKYQDILKKYTSKLEIEVSSKQDPKLNQLFIDAKNLIIKHPNIKEEFLDFYTDWLKEEYTLITKADLESSIRIFMHISEKIRELSSNTYKKDGITYVTLDESILDISSWLPKKAIQDVVKLIKKHEEQIEEERIMKQKEKLKQFLEDLKNNDELLEDFIKHVDNN
jgi:hypothetical protein